MAQKFYNVAKAAEVLGVSPAEVNTMREQQELHGYRDGADWKFKAEDIEQLAASRQGAPAEGEEDVLVTEFELGLSDPGASGTVIGPPPAGAEDAPAEPKSALDSAVNGFEELEFTFDDSQLGLSGGSSGKNKVAPPGSGIDLSADALDDDDLVLGGSSSGGSGLTLGGDSGISLIDPTDSGLSLEEPLELGDGSSDSLSLSGDSLLSLDDVSTDKAATAAGDSDFTLTPMDEILDDDSAQSDSQVIALDSEGPDELETMPAMLDEEPALDLGEVSAMPLEEVGAAVPLSAAGGFGAAIAQETAAPRQQAAASMVLSEAPYSGLNITSLSICTFLLALVGMMMYDVMQNMWSWNGVHALNSPILDWLSSMLG